MSVVGPKPDIAVGPASCPLCPPKADIPRPHVDVRSGPKNGLERCSGKPVLGTSIHGAHAPGGGAVHSINSGLMHRVVAEWASPVRVHARCDLSLFRTPIASQCGSHQKIIPSGMIIRTISAIIHSIFVFLCDVNGRALRKPSIGSDYRLSRFREKVARVWRLPDNDQRDNPVATVFGRRKTLTSRISWAFHGRDRKPIKLTC